MIIFCKQGDDNVDDNDTGNDDDDDDDDDDDGNIRSQFNLFLPAR